VVREGAVLGGDRRLGDAQAGGQRHPDAGQAAGEEAEDAARLVALQAEEVGGQHDRREHADVHQHLQVAVEQDAAGQPHAAAEEPPAEPLAVEDEAAAADRDVQAAAAEDPPQAAEDGHQGQPAAGEDELHAGERGLAGGLDVVDREDVEDQGAGGEAEAEPAGAHGPQAAAAERLQLLTQGPAGDQADDHQREQGLPPVGDPGGEAEHVQPEDRRDLLRVEPEEVVHVERVVQRVALGPHGAVLDGAGVAVEAGEVHDHQPARPGGDQAVDGLEAAGAGGRGGQACPVAGAARLAEAALLAQLPAAQPVVDAVGVAAAGEQQVEEEHAVDELGALPEQVVAEEEAVHEHEAQEPGDARLPAEHERRGDGVEGEHLDPHRPRGVEEVQQRVLLALEEVEPGGLVEEAVGVVAQALAEALELAGGDQLAGGVAEEDALVGEQELEVLEEVVDVADAEEGEDDAKEGDRARVLGGEPEPAPAVLLQGEHHEDEHGAGEQQPADGRGHCDGLLVRNAVIGRQGGERKCCGRGEPKHRDGSFGDGLAGAQAQKQWRSTRRGGLQRRGKQRPGACAGPAERCFVGLTVAGSAAIVRAHVRAARPYRPGGLQQPDQGRQLQPL
jgi:hypothetical protein